LVDTASIYQSTHIIALQMNKLWLCNVDAAW
jgi:hypothetical protein